MAEYVERADSGSASPPTGVAGVLNRTATWLAMSGGFVFCALIAMSIVSIVGRKLFSSPVQGDVELMQMGAAVGAAAFLPLCELHDNHIKVDALTSWMGGPARAALDTVAHLMLTVAAAAITWRTGMAVRGALARGAVAPLPSGPGGRPVAPPGPSFALLTLCGLYRVVLSFNLALGRSV